jgi:hypothetical protein
MLSGSRYSLRSPVALFAALTIALALGSVAAQDSSLTSPSPAEGYARVIAQGMSAPAAERVAWRVVDRTIPVRRDAVPSNRFADGAGFLLASDAPLFVTDQKSKLRLRLGVGEAAFVQQGANQTWASLEAEETRAYSLELVARDQVNAVAPDEIVSHSRSFVMPPADYDLDLVGATVGRNELAALSSGEYPLYILVVSGNVEVRTGGDDPERTRLEAGQAAPFRGEMTVRGRLDEGSSSVAAIIGPSIGGGAAAVATNTPAPTSEPKTTPPPEPTSEPTPEPTEPPEPTQPPAATASLTLDMRLCPAQMRPETLNADACGPLDGGYDLLLVRADGFTLGIADAPLVAPHTIRWSGLVSSTYELLIVQLPAGHDTAALDGYVCCSPAGGFTLVVGPGDQLWGTMTFFQPAVAAQVQPQVPQSTGGNLDFDLDGLTDRQEIDIYGTNPNLADTDGDGVIDSNEIAAGTNPFDPTNYPR